MNCITKWFRFQHLITVYCYFICSVLLQDNARQKYTELVSSLLSAESAGQTKDASPEESRHGGYETIIVTTENSITKIMFNRPERKNAINHQVKKWIWETYWFFFFSFLVKLLKFFESHCYRFSRTDWRLMVWILWGLSVLTPMTPMNEDPVQNQTTLLIFYKLGFSVSFLNLSFPPSQISAHYGLC